MKFPGIFSALLTGAMILSQPVLAEVEIKHKPVDKVKSGKRIEISADIEDKRNGIKEARAYFKSSRDTRFWFAPMEADGGDHVAILPAAALGAGTIDYRIYVVNGANEFQKTQLYTITVKDDEKALARLEAKEPTSVKVDTEQVEQARDVARRDGEPDPNRRVDVRNDISGSLDPSSIPGFNDYIVISRAPAAAAGGGLAGATSLTATSGVGATGVLLGAAALGGVAAAGGGSSGGGGGGGGASASSSGTGQVNVRDSGASADDSFQVFVDGSAVGGPTPLGGSSTSSLSGLSSGNHNLRLQFVQGADGAGTYTITLGQGVRFSDGTTSKTGTINGVGNSVAFTIVVP